MNNTYPLIIVCAGAHQPSLYRLPEILAEYSEHFFIGVDRGALELVRANFPLDLGIGDFDSLAHREKLELQEKSKAWLEYPSAKDDTDTEIAFEWISQHYPQSDICVFGAIGMESRRLDHLIANLYLPYQPRFQDLFDHTYFVEENLRMAWYFSGDHILQAGPVLPDYLSVISLTPVKSLKIEGAKYNLASQDFDFPRALVSNEFIALNQPIHLSFKEGLILVIWMNEEERFV
ncbi:thiamine diphosphokinase [Ignavigranum ruoffiae]|uniref:thiamine diphosphokinase n=1 Tax=Ignavigranum ruoffiae TaxID=89093 RepID=UPI003B00CD04